MDEVARERASAAHLRLDGINGQIIRLRDSVDETRGGLRDDIAELREDHAEKINDLKVEVAKVKTRTGIYAAIGAGIASAVLAPVVVVALVYALHLNRPQTPHVSRTPVAAVRSPR